MERSSTGQLGSAMQRNREQITRLRGAVRETSDSLQRLRERAQGAGGASQLLASRIAQEETRLRSLNGQLRTASLRYGESVARAREATESVRGLSQAYSELSRNIQQAAARREALGALQSRRSQLGAQRGQLMGELAATAGSAMTVALPVKIATGFEDEMAKVNALSGATKEQLAQLTEQARQLGRDTKYSASEAAQAMQYLSMAGFKTNQTFAAMPGLLSLAAASGTDLATSADIASNVLTGMGMKAEEMDKAADVLANTCVSANVNMTMLGDTMKYIAPVAHAAGMSLDEAAAYAGIMGNAGVQGTMAGTSLRASLSRLAGPPKMAAKALYALGVSTKDTSGNMLPLMDILTQLKTKMAGLGNADKIANLKHIFGEEAFAGMQAIIDQLDDAKKLIDANASSQGKAKQVADKMNASTAGALRQLKSAWEDVGIEIGNVFLPTIKTVAGVLSGVANRITGFAQTFPILTKGILITAGSIAALTVGATVCGLAVNVMRSSFVGLRLAMLPIGGIASMIGPALMSMASVGKSAVISLVTAVRTGTLSMKTALISTGIGALVVGIGMAASFVVEHWTAVKTFFQELGPSVMSRLSPFIDQVKAPFIAVAETVQAAWTGITDFFVGVWESLTSGASSAWDFVSSAASGAWSLIQTIWTPVAEFFTVVFGPVVDFFTNAWTMISGMASSCVDTVMSVWNGVVGFFGGIVDGITGVFSGMFSWLAEKFSWVLSVIDFIKGAVSAITGGVAEAASKGLAAEQRANMPKDPTAGKGGASAPSMKPAGTGVRSVPKQNWAAPTNPSGEKKGGGGKKRSGGGGGRKSGGSSAESKTTGTTIVSIAGDNSKTVTEYIPASQSRRLSTPVASGAKRSVVPEKTPDYDVVKLYANTVQFMGGKVTKGFSGSSSGSSMPVSRPVSSASTRRAIPSVASGSKPALRPSRKPSTPQALSPVAKLHEDESKIPPSEKPVAPVVSGAKASPQSIPTIIPERKRTELQHKDRRSLLLPPSNSLGNPYKLESRTMRPGSPLENPQKYNPNKQSDSGKVEISFKQNFNGISPQATERLKGLQPQFERMVKEAVQPNNERNSYA